MSQKSVESLLGRLLTDQEFRHRFFEEPAVMCRQESLDVSSRELEAVLHVSGGEFERFAKTLDPRIVRAVVRRDACADRLVKDAGELGVTKIGAVK